MLKIHEIYEAVRTATEEEKALIRKRAEEEPDEFFAEFPYPEIACEEFMIARNAAWFEDVLDIPWETAYAMSRKLYEIMTGAD